jgi:hypothetical protein
LTFIAFDLHVAVEQTITVPENFFQIVQSPATSLQYFSVTLRQHGNEQAENFFHIRTSSATSCPLFHVRLRHGQEFDHRAGQILFSKYRHPLPLIVAFAVLGSGMDRHLTIDKGTGRGQSETGEKGTPPSPPQGADFRKTGIEQN